jgi:signal transduction histidine kinase
MWVLTAPKGPIGRLKIKNLGVGVDFWGWMVGRGIYMDFCN